jgi:hypothetical protein
VINLPKTTGGVDVVKWISIGLTVISLFGGTMVWASTQLDTLEKDIKSDVREDYVKKEDYARIEERIINQDKQLDDMNKKLDTILTKIHDR